MTVTQEYLYEALLSHNYFPMVREKRDDIPGLFSTELFLPSIADSLISNYNKLDREHYKKRFGFDQISYRTTKYNNTVRLMHIPHPMPYSLLCNQLRESWNESPFQDICNNSCSKIRPKRHDDGRIVVSEDYEKVESGRVVVMEHDRGVSELNSTLANLTGKHYLVEADIASFFPTLYSHAIPWALVGHSAAKNDRSLTQWFNKVDLYYRQLKRGETQGAPIGPATSNIIAECILLPVDRVLGDQGFAFIRHIDDYKCYCTTLDEAERFLRELEQQLSLYLLSLNTSKVKIHALPIPLDSDWVTTLRQRVPTQDASPRDVYDFLNLASSLNKHEPDGSVLKYAIRAISHHLNPGNLNAFIQYSLQLAFHYPTVLPMVCENYNSTVTIRPDHLESLLQKQVNYRRSDAICWTIALFGLSSTPIPNRLAKEIVGSGDCMGMLTLLALQQHTDIVQEFAKSIDPADHYRLDQYWLLLHELNLRENLPGAFFDTYIADTGLDYLASQSVSFLRSVDDLVSDYSAKQRKIFFDDSEF